MWTRQTLTDHLAHGNAVEFLFFWGHTQKHNDTVDSSCLSQWYARPFSAEGVRYLSAEHYMMSAKARLFHDHETLAQILASETPAEAKALGRAVRNYQDDAWARARVETVVRGNLAKFGEHADLRAFLLGTGDRMLVEASPSDAIWGIGLDAANPDVSDPTKWPGENLLGFALMEARAALKAQ